MAKAYEIQVCFWLGGAFNGGKIFLVMPNCNTNNMSIFLKELSKTYSEDIMILVCDGAAWHKSKNLEISGNIIITHIPPYTPEMNPIEQIWKQIRQMGFGNKIFKTLNAVVNKLCDTIAFNCSFLLLNFKFL